MTQNWMIYGANGYTGELIAREAGALGMTPVLAGRNESAITALAKELGLQHRIFTLDDPKQVGDQIHDMFLVLHCAGPFSATAAPMIRACLDTGTHYLDITGEILVFELAKLLRGAAKEKGIILCPGVGFDVIPTDCVAAQLNKAMRDATHLALGFDSSSGLSPGTAKTSVEGLALGGRIRAQGKLKKVPLAYKTRKIDFGNGEKYAMTIPWGDISTAYSTTGIPNIEVYMPMHPKLIKKIKRLNWFRWLLRFPGVQNVLKKRVDKTVRGPDEQIRKQSPTYVWGEVKNHKGETKTARIRVANGYTVTVHGALVIVEHLLNKEMEGGYYTPSALAGPRLIQQLPESGEMVLE
ncbi:MAG: saccharopine dehydrogenase NADP-binding domain-containing protein [Gammaproteobacteria bacterium]|nr:saccharopine dehydrogenase NADP-binding domain-containing protein [Gammaproteobacteria bacterium]